MRGNYTLPNISTCQTFPTLQSILWSVTGSLRCYLCGSYVWTARKLFPVATFKTFIKTRGWGEGRKCHKGNTPPAPSGSPSFLNVGSYFFDTSTSNLARFVNSSLHESQPFPPCEFFTPCIPTLYFKLNPSSIYFKINPPSLIFLCH